MNVPRIHRHNTLIGTNTVNQNTNTPDFDLDTDIVGAGIEREIPLGMDLSELAAKKFRINIASIVISALIFLIILAWFDFIQTVFYNYLYPPTMDDAVPSYVKLWYSIAVTIFIILIIMLIYYYTSI